MSKYYNTSLDKVPNTGGSVRLTIGTDGATANEAFQTTSTPCKKVWLIASRGDIRVNIGSACTADTGIPVSYEVGTTGTLPLMLEIDDINNLYFYGATTGKTIDILYRE